MKILFLDFESQGKEPENNITEVGAAIFDQRQDLTWAHISDYSDLVWDLEYPKQSSKIFKITGISDEMLKSNGVPPKVAIQNVCDIVSKVDYVFTHNVAFDKAIFMDKVRKFNLECAEKDWICTMSGGWYDEEKFGKRNLLQLAWAHDPNLLVVNGKPVQLHRALDDALLTARLTLTHYSLGQILNWYKKPWIYLQAKVSYADKDLAKERGFSWLTCFGDESKRVFEKCWVKRVKDYKPDPECPFEVIQLGENL